MYVFCSLPETHKLSVTITDGLIFYFTCAATIRQTLEVLIWVTGVKVEVRGIGKECGKS